MSAQPIRNNTNKQRPKQKGNQSKPLGRKPRANPSKTNHKTKNKNGEKESYSLIDRIKSMTEEQLTIAGYILCFFYIITLSYRYYRAIWWLSPIVITNNPVLIFLLIVVPFGIWAYSTKFDRFNYHEKKRRNLYFAIGSAIFTLIQPIVYVVNRFIISPKILKIEVTENMTKGMVLMLGRIIILIALGIAFALVYMPIKATIGNNAIQEKIDVFRITHHIDERKNKEWCYDEHIIRDLNTGKERTILEDDRFIHQFINGASGTGKTSSTITPAVADDLNQKLKNRTQREKELLELVKAGKCYVVGPIKNVTEYNVKPKPKYKEEYLALYKKYPDCGITIMAPNNSMNDDVVKLCEAKGIPVNVLDPAKKYTEKCARRVGLNPFYIPIGLSEEERVIAISEASTNFSEVIVATNEQGGQGDQYFRDINTSVTQNIAACIMLANNIKRKQTNIIEVQQCINNFTDLQPYVDAIEQYYQINIEVDEISKKKTKDQETSERLSDKRIKSEKEIQMALRGRKNPYYETLHFVKQELLGAGQEKMFDQARGLRNLINKILLDPRYKELLSADPSFALDWAKALKNAEVTVINTAIEFGQQMSTAFGLFTLLTFDVQVKKRPKDARSNHFLWIDEGAQYLHKVYDDMINLYRQYRVGVSIAMQKISQMERVQTTAYLKEVILGAGTQIVFGRVSAEEMKMYSELAGLENTEIIQKSSTSTSMMSENASQSMQERATAERSNILEGHDIRVRDFQEVTVFTVKHGRVETGYVGKLNFVNRKEFVKTSNPRVNWTKYITKRGEVQLTPPAKKVVKQQKQIIKQRTVPTKLIPTVIEEPKVLPPIEETIDLDKNFLEGMGNLFEDEPTELLEEEVIVDNKPILIGNNVALAEEEPND